MNIGNGIYVLKLSSNAMGAPTAVYPTLLVDNDSLILIDTGIPGMFNQISEAIEKEGLHLDKLNKIIFTHQDIDHIGNVAEIKKNVSGKIKTYCHEIEKPYINGEKTPVKLAELESNRKNLLGNMKMAYKMLKVGFANNKVDINETLHDGEELPYCGGIVIIDTPGHTPGHISLYLKQHKILICGDIFVNDNGLLSGVSKELNFDNELNIESTKKLMNYDIQTVISYHGGIFTDNVNKRIVELFD